MAEVLAGLRVLRRVELAADDDAPAVVLHGGREVDVVEMPNEVPNSTMRRASMLRATR